MGDVRFGVELFLAIDPADDFAGTDCFDNGRYAKKEIIF